MAFQLIQNSGSYGTDKLQDFPEECPECHKKIIPIFITHKFSKHKSKVFAFLNCPNPDCDISFSAEYHKFPNSSMYVFIGIVKGNVKKEFFSEEILKLSDGFIKIFNESYFAEQNSLFEICGVGYRKALEFLIKDYLIHKFPEKEQEIKKHLLGKCINDYVNENRIKETAKRAAWLGNDHTHYVKKWNDKDLNDLKLLIKLSVNWIESELMTEQFINSMAE